MWGKEPDKSIGTAIVSKGKKIKTKKKKGRAEKTCDQYVDSFLQEKWSDAGSASMAGLPAWIGCLLNCFAQINCFCSLASTRIQLALEYWISREAAANGLVRIVAAADAIAT